jgi:hypothetical protein
MPNHHIKISTGIPIPVKGGRSKPRDWDGFSAITSAFFKMEVGQSIDVAPRTSTISNLRKKAKTAGIEVTYRHVTHEKTGSPVLRIWRTK